MNFIDPQALSSILAVFTCYSLELLNDMEPYEVIALLNGILARYNNYVCNS